MIFKKAKNEHDAIEDLESMSFDAVYIIIPDEKPHLRARFLFPELERTFVTSIERQMKHPDNFYDVWLREEEFCQILADRSQEQIMVGSELFVPIVPEHMDYH